MEATELLYTSRQYRLNRTGQDGATVIIVLPPAVYWREARIRGLSVDEFIKQFCVRAHYGYFNTKTDGSTEGVSQGVYYTFEAIRHLTRAEAAEENRARMDKITQVATTAVERFKARKAREMKENA